MYGLSPHAKGVGWQNGTELFRSDEAGGVYTGQALKKAGVARVPEVYTAIGQNGVFWRKALFGSCKHIFLMRKDCHLPAGEISPMGLNGCKHTISSRRCWPAFRCFKRSFRTTLFLLAEKAVVFTCSFISC